MGVAVNETDWPEQLGFVPPVTAIETLGVTAVTIDTVVVSAVLEHPFKDAVTE